MCPLIPSGLTEACLFVCVAGFELPRYPRGKGYGGLRLELEQYDEADDAGALGPGALRGARQRWQL